MLPRVQSAESLLPICVIIMLEDDAVSLDDLRAAHERPVGRIGGGHDAERHRCHHDRVLNERLPPHRLPFSAMTTTVGGAVHGSVSGATDPAIRSIWMSWRLISSCRAPRKFPPSHSAIAAAAIAVATTMYSIYELPLQLRTAPRWH